MNIGVLETSKRVPGNTYKLQAIDRAVALLNLLGHSHVPLGLTDVSRQLGMHKSTTQRFLRVLEGHHLVSCRTDGRYHLGLHLRDLGDPALDQFDIRD